MRQTLQECIDLFNSNEPNRTSAIRNMEQLGEWKVAAKYWRKLDRYADVDACNMIADAIRKGDAYRKECEPLYEWIEKTVENEIMTKQEAIKHVYEQLRLIYQKHYE